MEAEEDIYVAEIGESDQNLERDQEQEKGNLQAFRQGYTHRSNGSSSSPQKTRSKTAFKYLKKLINKNNTVLGLYQNKLK